MITASGQMTRGTGLAFRMIAFLSVALVPIGIVAYYQTAQLSDQTRVTSELSVVAGTEAAAAPELEVILRALGSAAALGTVVQGIDGDPQTCLDYLGDYVEHADEVSFAGFLKTDAQVTCSSDGRVIDMAGAPGLDDLLANPRPTVHRSSDPEVSDGAVIVVSQPAVRDETFAGYMAVSVPVEALHARINAPMPQDMLDLMIFNGAGDLLSSRGDDATASARLPEGFVLQALVAEGRFTLVAEDAENAPRVYAVAPLVPDLLYAVSVWTNDGPATRAFTQSRLAVVLPLLMWMASVIVAFFAVNRLVIRHIRTIRIQMRRFARSRTLPKAAVNNDMPQELRDVEEDFFHLADAIMQDEARLEDGLREKGILLKEIHHRVKNNLQLISSIMNMHIRQSKSSETQDVLGRLQHRIQGLSAIHRNLYQTENLSAVNVRELLGELVQELMKLGQAPMEHLDVETDLADLLVYPDQAMPLSLLVAEALTNALKYGGPDRTGENWIRVSFAEEAGGFAVVTVANSRSAASPKSGAALHSGLGSRLLQAFGTQLGGQVEVIEEDESYVVTARFRLMEFQPDVVDY